MSKSVIFMPVSTRRVNDRTKYTFSLQKSDKMGTILVYATDSNNTNYTEQNMTFKYTKHDG